jgi:hypothetical protein
MTVERCQTDLQSPLKVEQLGRKRGERGKQGSTNVQKYQNANETGWADI